MRHVETNGKSALIKWLVGIISSVFLIWVSSLQAGYLRLAEADINIKEQLAAKAEIIAAHETDLRDMRPRVVRIEDKIDRVLELQRRAS